MTNSCTAGWLGGQSFLSASPADLTKVTTTRAGAPARDGSEGSGSGGRSVVPSSPPSGAVGGSATGGSGIAQSGFFTFAGLLRLAPLRAMRRLRLSRRPLLTAFFVLIPERPG
jgi:hypothetical protein